MPALEEIRRSIPDRKRSMDKNQSSSPKRPVRDVHFVLGPSNISNVFSALAGRMRPGSPHITPSRKNQTRNHLPSESSAKLALAWRVVGRTRVIAELVPTILQ